MDYHWLFLAVLPIIAFLYASVGHGGASGYLALMALFSFPESVMRPTGLLLNLFVAAIAFYYFWKKGFFNPRLFFAFAIGSIPLSYLGGLMQVDPYCYKIILALLLVFAILKLLNIYGKENEEINQIKWIPALFIGAGIGFSFWSYWNWWWYNFKPFDSYFKMGKCKRSCSSICTFHLG